MSITINMRVKISVTDSSNANMGIHKRIVDLLVYIMHKIVENIFSNLF